MRKILTQLLSEAIAAILLVSGAFAAEITPSTSSITLGSTETTCTFDISLRVDHAFAGAEFGIKPSQSDVSISMAYLDDLKNESQVRTQKDGVLYFGFFAGTNKYAAGDYQVARVTCTYAGSGTRTVTLDSSKIVTINANGETFGDVSSDAFTVTITKESSTGGGDSGGGGAAVVPTFTLTFNTNGGSAIAGVSKASGTTVDLTTYKPTKTDYDFDGWYSDSSLTTKVTSVKLTKNTTVYAKWTEKEEIPDLPFTDVPDDSYYKDAVSWAVDNGITEGTGAAIFNPNGICTRAQAVTFLWRANGSPAPKSTAMPFHDVPTESYYYNAVLWSVEQGIIKGTSETTFSPDMNCSRAHIVTMLWRSESSKSEAAANPFTDVTSDAYYADAVLWAVGKKVTEGTSATTFSPDDNCTRAQIVTFIYRDKK